MAGVLIDDGVIEALLDVVLFFSGTYHFLSVSMVSACL